MDAPPAQEDCGPFIKVAGFLEKIGVNSPRVLEADLSRGFLLLTDLGSQPYLHVIEQQPDRARALYDDALDALLRIQERGREYQSQLPAYDETLLRFELSLFRDWLCEKHLGIEFSEDEDAAWRACCDVLVANALRQPQVFVHRDYHSRNLMLTGRANPGIIDFQDAVEGPLTYDLVSLLRDCYIKWPPEQTEQWAERYRKRLPESLSGGLDRDTFLRCFDLMGIQRHLKAAGIFARLLRRDGKPGYMKDVPRTLSYIVDLAPRYAELRFIAKLIEQRVLPALEDSAR